MSALTRRSAAVASLCLLLLIMLVVSSGAGAGAAEGDIRVIGGQGPHDPKLPATDTSCALPSVSPKPRPAPDRIVGGIFNSSAGMRGLAVDPTGAHLFLAVAHRVLGYHGVVAGGGDRSPGSEAVPATQAAFKPISGLAVDPGGQALWIVDQESGEFGSGNVYRLDLRASGNPVTFATSTAFAPRAVSADARGNAYFTDTGGRIFKVDAPVPGRAASVTQIGHVPGAGGIAVDANGTSVYVSSTDNRVYSLNGTSSPTVIAGGTVPHADGGTPALHFPAGLAIGHQVEGEDIRGKYLYIADQLNNRVLRVEFRSDNTRVITTVAGGGTTYEAGVGKATERKVQPRLLAADMALPLAHVFIGAPDQCAIYQLDTPAAFRLPADGTTQGTIQVNTTLPADTGQKRDNLDTAAGTTGNSENANNSTATQQGQARTEIVPGSETQVQSQPQTELRVIDQGNVVATPEQAAQPSVEPVPAPGTAAQFTPTPAASPAPTPTPAPADVSTAVAPDPGPTSAAAADASSVVPPAPAAAPVPPAPASAPPLAAPEPVSTPGLVHGDSAAPARGGTRYAMVRNDEEQSVAALAMAGAGAMAAVFLCVLFVAPGPSSKPKPRPKGAY